MLSFFAGICYNLDKNSAHVYAGPIERRTSDEKESTCHASDSNRICRQYFLGGVLTRGEETAAVMEMMENTETESEGQTEVSEPESESPEGESEPGSEDLTGESEPESEGLTGESEPESEGLTGESEPESEEPGEEAEPESETENVTVPEESEWESESAELGNVPPTEAAETGLEGMPELAGGTARKLAYYRVAFYVAMEGDISADLSGLTFYLYEQKPGQARTLLQTKTSYNGSTGCQVMFQVQIEETEISSNTYTVELADNPSYEMETVNVIPDKSYSPQYTINVNRKPVPPDNAEASVSTVSSWSGTGSAEDPFAGSCTVDTNTGTLAVRAVSEKATLTYEGSAYAGSMTLQLQYETHTYAFTVTSEDGTVTNHYALTVTRPKYQPIPPQTLVGGLTSAPGAADGKITGLEKGKVYEYRKKGETSYIQVSEESTEITGLAAGTYYVRFAETESRYPSADSTVKVKDPVERQVAAGKVDPEIQFVSLPGTVYEGQALTFQIQIPANRLVDVIRLHIGNKTLDLGGANAVYAEDGNGNHIVTVTYSGAEINNDVVIDITLKAGEYYAVDTQSLSEIENVTVTFDQTPVWEGKKNYFPVGTMLKATAALPDNWKGLGELTRLEAVRADNGETLRGTLVSSDKNTWTLEFEVSADAVIYCDAQPYPGDVSELTKLLAAIGDLNRYVDNVYRENVEEQLELSDVMMGLTMKEQDTIDAYTNVLKALYTLLTLRLDLSDNADTVISLDNPVYIYDGNPWKPNVTVTYQGTALTEGQDFRVIYPQDMTAPGIKTITIEFLGRYIGSDTVEGKILQQYVLYAEAGEHGQITPSGQVYVVEGESQQFVIQADSGYHISEILVDGTPLELSGETQYTYTFENVQKDGSVRAAFAEDEAETEETETEETETEETETEAETELTGEKTDSKPQNTAAAAGQNSSASEAVDTADRTPVEMSLFAMAASLLLALTLLWIRRNENRE